ncbi:MAG: TldD/PmbA family protein [Candidatus Scalinduaceae bacterium]
MNLHIETLDKLKEQTFETLSRNYKSLKECKYADLKLGISEFKSACSENGQAKDVKEECNLSFGIRVVAGEMSSWGFYGQSLGKNDLRNKEIKKLITSGMNIAYERAIFNAKKKREFKSMADSLTEVRLAKVKVCQDTVTADFEIDPRGITSRKILSTSMNVSKQMKDVDDTLKFTATEIKTGITRELFFNSEGAKIDKSFALTQGMIYVSAQKDDLSPEVYYDCLGDLRGWEVIEGKNACKLSLLDFALEKTKDTVELAGAEFLKSSEGEEIVVTNPHFNTLLIHEIVGHPTEADRALKMETAYAGRSWLFNNLSDNQIGSRIASPLVNAFSDPTMAGYGHYKYDSEGTPAKRVNLIEDGVLKDFLNGRETAAILGQEPNGSMRATDPSLVPLVRMTNTAFGSGEKTPEEIIKEVEDGYYVVNHRIPSISESRENFRISAQKVYKIKNGNLVKLYRGGAVMADSKDFLMSVDAVGNDFKLYPVPNCGKGQPMQIMRVGNGGPTLRGRARVTGC